MCPDITMVSDFELVREGGVCGGREEYSQKRTMRDDG
jgi:hypothetical protein